MSFSDLEAVGNELASRLEGATTLRLSTVRGARYRIDGRWRGRSVRIECWHGVASRFDEGWEVSAAVGESPSYAVLRRRVLTSALWTANESVFATDDASFDAKWVLEAAPKRVARLVFDAEVRNLVTAVWPGRPRLEEVIFYPDVQPPLVLDGGKITAYSTRYDCDAGTVGKALELITTLAARWSSVLDPSAASSSAEGAREEANEVAASRQAATARLTKLRRIALTIVLVIAALGCVQTVYAFFH